MLYENDYETSYDSSYDYTVYDIGFIFEDDEDEEELSDYYDA